MKLLLVSQSILPYKGGSSMIVENLAMNFSEDEMVVLGARKLSHSKKNTRLQSGVPKFKYFFSELSIFGRGARFFDWFRTIRFKPLLAFIKETIDKEKIDYVIGVFPNSFYCLAACQAAEEMGVKFSSYFHNTYVENTANKEKDAVEIQEEIFQKSEFIFVMSKGMEEFYERKYKLGKFIPLVHTYNQNIKPAPTTLEEKDQYKLVAIGNFNESNIDATSRFVNAITNDPRFSLALYTHVPKVLLAQRGINVEAIDYKGFINPDQIQNALSEYDICVLTHGFTGGYGEVEYQTIFPTRTIPLLLSGKPIIAHSPAHSFLSRFIKEYECAALVESKSEADIISTLEKLIGDKSYREHLLKGVESARNLFYGPKVAAFLKDKIGQ